MKTKRRISVSEVIMPDASPVVLRAHAIADTLRALALHGQLGNWSNDARAAIAEDLHVPEMWLEAAFGATGNAPTVSLELLEEYRDWRVRVLDDGKEA